MFGGLHPMLSLPSDGISPPPPPPRSDPGEMMHRGGRLGHVSLL